MNGLYCQPIKVPQHASSAAQHNQQPGGVFPRRDTQSTNWAPRDKYTTSTTSQKLPIILNGQWKFSWPEAAGGATASQVTRFPHTLPIEHLNSPVCTPPLSPCYRQRHITVFLHSLQRRANDGAISWSWGFPPGPRSLSLPLPLYLLQGSPSIPCALPEITALCPLLWP